MLSSAVSFRSAPVPVAVSAAEGEEAGRDRPAKPTSREAQTTAVVTKPASSTAPSRTVPVAAESEEATWLSMPSKLGS